MGPVGETGGMAWAEVLGLAADERPVAVIVEGSWWRAERTRRRLARLASPRELGVPDVHLGRREGRAVLYACPYGAARTAEVVHIGARVGAGLAVQVGSCGVVGEGIHPGDVVIPTSVTGADGVSRLYHAAQRVPASEDWASAAAERLEALGVTVHRGPALSWPTLFHQPVQRVREWHREGYLGVDMETAATLAVARRLGIEAIGMLVAWDELLSGRSFLEPLAPAEAEAFARADESIYAVALELASRLPER